MTGAAVRVMVTGAVFLVIGGGDWDVIFTSDKAGACIAQNARTVALQLIRASTDSRLCAFDEHLLSNGRYMAA